MNEQELVRAAQALYEFELPPYYGSMPTYEQYVVEYPESDIWRERARVALKAAASE